MKKLALLAPLLLAFSASAAMEVGVNSDFVDFFTLQRLYADSMRSSPYFGSVGSPSDQTCVTDANGWPTTACGILVMNTTGASDAGAYSLRLTGNPVITVNASPGWTLSGQAYNSGTNITTATLTNTGSATQLQLIFSTVVSNVSLMLPGHTFGVDKWNKRVIAAIVAGKFSGFRMMDASFTNGNPQRVWADRPAQSYATQRQFWQHNTSLDQLGISWEDQFDLCNTLHAASAKFRYCWINVPMLVDETYITNLANLAHSSLNANVIPIIELGNENWNSSFSQYGANVDAAGVETAGAWLPSHAYSQGQYAVNAGRGYVCSSAGTSAASGGPTTTGSFINDGTAQWNYIEEDVPARHGILDDDSSTNLGQLARRRLFKRSHDISVAFATAYGANSTNTKFKVVVESQIVSPSTFTDGADWAVTHYAVPLSTWMWGGGGAPYFEVERDDRTNLTTAGILAELNYKLDNMLPTQILTTCTAVKRYGLKCVMYEGGAGQQGSASLAAKVGAQTDPKMQTLTERFLKINEKGGVDLLMYYKLISPNDQFGCWGLLSDMADLTTPKFKAMVNWGTKSSAHGKYRQVRNAVTPTVDSEVFFDSSGCRYFNGSGSWAEYQFDSPAAELAKLTINYISGTGNTMKMEWNGVSIWDPADITSNGGVQGDLAPLFVQLKPGVNSLRMTSLSAGQPGFCTYTLTDQ